MGLLWESKLSFEAFEFTSELFLGPRRDGIHRLARTSFSGIGFPPDPASTAFVFYRTIGYDPETKSFVLAIDG